RAGRRTRRWRQGATSSSCTCAGSAGGGSRGGGAPPGRTPPPVGPPPPRPPPAGHLFPVAGPHTYGDRFGAPRNGYSHQGQDILAAEGTPVVAPIAGAISFTDYQPSAAGYYIVEKGSDGFDYFFAHFQKCRP